MVNGNYVFILPTVFQHFKIVYLLYRDTWMCENELLIVF